MLTHGGGTAMLVCSRHIYLSSIDLLDTFTLFNVSTRGDVEGLGYHSRCEQLNIDDNTVVEYMHRNGCQEFATVCVRDPTHQPKPHMINLARVQVHNRKGNVRRQDSDAS
jgi:hypothetical protein